MARCMSRAVFRQWVMAAALPALTVTGCAQDRAVLPVTEPQLIVLGPRDVANARRTAISSGIVLTGSLNPSRQVDVRAQVPGVVTGMEVDRGEAVRAGQILATIEAQGIRSQAVSAEAQIAGAQSNVSLALRRLESAEMLYHRGAVSQLDFQTAQAQLEAAEAQLAATRAQAASARESAARTSIQAPLTGVVSQRVVSQGEAVQPGQTLFTIVDTTFLELAGQAPVEEAAQVRVGQPVVFTLDGYPDRIFRGSVARIDPIADPATRQVGVFVRLANADGRLFGGLFATGRVLTGTDREVVVVPEEAIRGSGGSRFIWTIRDNVIVRAPVVTGALDRSNGMVEITSGVEDGTPIVVGPGAVTEGARVRLGQSGVRGSTPAAAESAEVAHGHARGDRS